MDSRQRIGRFVHDVWTDAGTDPSGLAPPLLDGRLDALARFVFRQDDPELPHHSPTAVYRSHCTSLSYEDFLTKYMMRNEPVIITGLTESWNARNQWVNTETSEPDIDFLESAFFSDTVLVYEQEHGGFSSNARPKSTEMSMGEYAAWWREHSLANHGPLLYLKDWKFMAAHPDCQAYVWPHYFQDDWLNQAMGNAYKFVYLGPKGTSTVLHIDVLQSFSWSTNICGRKRWYMVPPHYEYLLYDCFGKNLAPHLHADNNILFSGLPDARKVAICVDQQAGETIFVPSRWYHTVENLEATLSINHNWLNGTNIRYAWERTNREVRAHSTGSVDHDKDNASGDNAQVQDDLILLWHVVIRKLQSILESTERIWDVDFKSIHLVLQGVKKLADDGFAQYLSERFEFDIANRLSQLDHHVKKVKTYKLEVQCH